MSATLRWIQMVSVALLAIGLSAQKSPEEALRALTEGNRRFATDKSVPQPVGEGVRRTLARGQSPFAVVVCCSDSRVPPEHIFNCGLGELFVIRIAGNTCDRETLASIEYAVEQLNAPLCVILGHESCGAVSAAIEQVQAVDNGHANAAQSPAIQSLLEQIEPAVRKARGRDFGGKELHDACEEENVHLCLHECLRRSPLLRRFVQVGKLSMVGARYHLDSGVVEWLPNRPLPPEPHFDFDPAAHAIPNGAPPHVALRMLQAGHRRFLGDALPAGDLSAARRESLTHGQQPLAIVLTDADSRVPPEHVFDAGLGELFVIRIAGNVVTDNVLASIEYAASHTGASLLVVMGHTNCGMLAAAATQPEGKELTPNMRALLGRLEPSVERVRADGGADATVADRAVSTNVLRAAHEVMARSSMLRGLESRGRFAVLSSVYDVASGNLTWLRDVPEAHAAPAGESAPAAGTAEPGAGGANGHDANGHDAGGHDAPGKPAAGHGVTPALPHGDAVHAPATVLDWADKGQAHVAEPVDHHADPHGAASTGGHGSHDDGHGAGAADTHGEAHAADPTHDAKAHTKPWQDPILVVGMAGVGSLLLAAFVALIRR